MDTSLLKELGFKTAAEGLEFKKEQGRKMLVAYENYRFVTPEIFERFRKELRKKTEKQVSQGQGWGPVTTYDQLAFISIDKYSEVPPMEVLNAMKEAKERGCFDYFEVAKIETVEVRPDPILFGGIKGCKDKFFVAQWENDVKIEDILKDNEG